MGSLKSASSYLSRFAVVERSPVNEELQKNFSELCIVNFYRYNFKKNLGVFYCQFTAFEKTNSAMFVVFDPIYRVEIKFLSTCPSILPS